MKLLIILQYFKIILSILKKNCEVKLEDYFNLTNNSINNINYNISVDGNCATIKHNIFQNFSNSNKLLFNFKYFLKKNHPIIKILIIFLMVL